MKKAWVFLVALTVALALIPALAEANSGNFSGSVAIGTSYAGVTSPPTNGMIVQGDVGIGTTTVSHALELNGTLNASGATTLGSTLDVTGVVTLSNLNTAGVVTTDSSGVLSTNSTLPAARFPTLTGDVTTAGSSLATTVVNVNGVAYPSSPSTDTAPVITASNTATYKSIPNCTDSGGNHLNYSTSTHAFSCGTLTKGITRINNQVFTSSGTYTPTSGLVYVDVELCGAGGGGGGSVGAGSGGAAGGGGGGGGYARKIVAAATIGASQTVTIGSGGAGGAAGTNTGSTGGTTSFGSIFSATGGGGAAGGSNNTGTFFGAAGAGGGSGFSGDVNLYGGAGGIGYIYGASANSLGGFGGAGTVFGAITSVPTANVAGFSGVTCSGGSGGASANLSKAGGTGGNGLVVVHEYISD